MLAVEIEIYILKKDFEPSRFHEKNPFWYHTLFFALKSGEDYTAK